MEHSKHFKDMLKERQIEVCWIDETLNEPDKVEDHHDGTRHYIRKIPENEDRYLRVIINESVRPPKAVTAFFDRRLRSKT